MIGPFTPAAVRWLAGALLCALLVGLAAPGASPAAAQATRACPTRSAPRWRPPVAAPVAVGFSLPAGQYGAGNRGLEYTTVAGRPVHAVGPGVVSFAGTVANERYVSVRHDAHTVSSYSYLDTIAVGVGDEVDTGSVLGTSGTRLQLGVRIDGIYVDPAPLLRPARLRPRLVPSSAVPPC